MVSPDNVLIKHSAAVHIDNQMSLVERKILNFLLKVSRPNIGTKVLKKEYHSVKIQEILNFLGHEVSNKNYHHIKESMHQLAARSIRFNIINKDKKWKTESTISFLSEVHFVEGVAFYAFSPTLAKALDRPQLYAKLNLDYQNNLSSKSALALWEFCCELLDSSKIDYLLSPSIQVDQLRALLGATSKSYDNFKIFNSKVLKIAIEEVNSSTDLEIKFQVVSTTNKKITDICFEIKRKQRDEEFDSAQIYSIDQDNQMELYPEPVVSLIEKTIEQQDLEISAGHLGLLPEQINNYLKTYESKEIIKAINYTTSRINNSHKIHNTYAYIWKLLESGLPDEVDSDEQIKINRKAKYHEALQKYSSLEGKAKEFYHVFAESYPDHFINILSQSNFIKYEDGILYLSSESEIIKDLMRSYLISPMNIIASEVFEDYRDYKILVDKS